MALGSTQPLKSGVDCPRLPGVVVRAQQTRPFVYALITVFVSSIAAVDRRREETPERHKTVSTERAQHTEIPLPRDKEPLRFGSTRAKFARDSVRSAARSNMVSTLRGEAMNIASCRSNAQSIPGFSVTNDLLKFHTTAFNDKEVNNFKVSQIKIRTPGMCLSFLSIKSTACQPCICPCPRHEMLHTCKQKLARSDKTTASFLIFS
jgi:hypothetical protein